MRLLWYKLLVYIPEKILYVDWFNVKIKIIIVLIYTHVYDKL